MMAQTATKPWKPSVHSGRNGQLGSSKLMEKQAAQLAKFERLVSSGEFTGIHSDHYDWWMFPIDERSSRGLEFTVFQDDIVALKQNPEFMKSYRKGMYLLLFSWGWDMNTNSKVKNAGTGQKWQMYPIRFYKVAKSALIFDQSDYFNSMKKYAEYLGEENLVGEDGLRVKKIFGLPRTESVEMPPLRYGEI